MISVFLPICLGGAIGSACRFVVSRMIQGQFRTTFPIGIFVVNCLGCFLIGLLWSLLEKYDVQQWIKLFVITGGLGAFTTFSTFGLDIVLMVEKQQIIPSFLYLLLSNFLGLLCVYLGRITSTFF